MSTAPAVAPVVVRLPTTKPAPIVFDSPHSGSEFPADFRPAAPRGAVLTSRDAFVDELCGDVPAAGGVLIAATFPRAYIDTNRNAGDVDEDLLSEPWPHPTVRSEYLARGMGLIRRYALPGIPLYDRPLSVAEVEHRIEHYYRPYRTALREELDRVWRRDGAVLHVNMHSMKARGNAMNVDQNAARPDVVVSDRNGTTANHAITQAAADFFRGLGYVTKINDPYRGGDIVASCGAPSERRHSVQVELNRALYMDESTFERGERFNSLQAHLAGFALMMAKLAREQAAEALAP